ncbi:haemagglutination activity domain protein [Synechococcus sp. PCC 7335]|uniref:two-partner secretion domain-containing protein n=1 Tax=Synechococcus sp. (strain ATCC 29403 / PCC 7335) TaxID=91464 RepID=UPI00017EE842|nr:filamentous hemagglutinin N-terminal domain-containing protein [Synechococcus sp. PCC 7335]EDX82476.1 haemagglutination activity domain protein [Synechococcus sp. PCC 7335]
MKKIGIFLSFFLYLTLHHQLAKAQIVPDATLDGGNSLVSGDVDIQVDGGTQLGGNLFHSFETFSIPEGHAVFFNNSIDVERILTRVTGPNSTSIDGLIRANGVADLYLLNPNGIDFLPNAALAIGGSFLATTGDVVRFKDGSVFNTEARDNSVLTSSVPVGLGLSSPNSISVMGLGHTLIGDPKTPLIELAPNPGLTNIAGEGIILIGGDVLLNGAVVRSPEGQIQLAAIQEGSVEFDQNLNSLSYRVEEGGSLSLADSSFLDIRGATGGSVTLTANEINMSGAATIYNSSSVESLPQNSIELASDSLIIGGRTPVPSEASINPLPSSIVVDNYGSGTGGSIAVQANDVRLSNGAVISQRSFASGVPGNVTVEASNSITVEGQSPYNPAATSSIISSNLGPSSTDQMTNLGVISVDTKTLNLIDGGSIISATLGSGNSANLNIEANDILVSSTAEPIIISSLIFTTTSLPPDISQLNATDLLLGNAGDITVNTDRLRLLDGGQIVSSSSSFGDAGRIQVNSTEAILIDGTKVGGDNSRITSGAFTGPPEAIEFFGFEGSPTGEAGLVSISTPSLTLRNAGAVGVQNEGTGNAGDLFINTEQLQVRSGGSISAITRGGQGGSIDIDSQTLFAGPEASISASAAGEGRGGNITIASDAIALIDGSSISADALEGAGGQVVIEADTLLQSDDSTITATSAAGPELSGVVDVRTLEDSLQTETEVVIPTALPQAANTCAGAADDSSFTTVGRDGLPTSNEGLLQASDGWNRAAEANYQTSYSPRNQIVEAQGWVPNGDGTVRFVNQLPNADAESKAAKHNCVNDAPV